MNSILRRVILFGLRRPVLAAFLSLLALVLAALPLLSASFSADITRMLPSGSKSERACAVLLNSGLFNQSAVLFAADTEEQLDAASSEIDRIADEIASVPGVTRVDNRFLPDDLPATLASFQERIPQFQPFSGLDAAEIVSAVKRKILLGGFASLALADPTGFAASKLATLEQFRSASSFHLKDGETAIVAPDGLHRLLLLETNISTADSVGGRRLMNDLEKVLAKHPISGVRADLLLAHAHSIENERVIKSDVKLACLLSILFFLPAILLLFRRDLRALAIPVFPAVVSLAAVGLLAIPGEPVLLFVTATGGLVIGLAVDYGVHVYMTMQTPCPARRLIRIATSLLTGAATSAAVFLLLALTPIPGVRQFGVFIGISLLASLLLTLLMFPSILIRSKTPLPKPHPLKTFSPKLACGVCFGMMTLFAALAVHRLTVRTDLRQFDAAQEKLSAAADAVERLFLDGPVQGVLAVHGVDADEALKHAESACTILTEKNPGLADRMFSPTFLIPTGAAREANLASWRASFDYDAFAKSLRAAAETEEFEPDAFDPFLASLERGLESSDMDSYPEVIAPVLNRVLRSASDGKGWYAAVFLPESALPLAEEILPPELETVPISRSSIPAQIVSDMKSAATFPVILAVLSVFTIAFLFFRNIRDSLCAMIPVAMALLTVCALYALCGKPLNLAAEMSLVLLSGLAIDYGVFVIGSERSAANPYVFRAISASALTTAAGGLTIAFAAHPLLHEAGFALIPGVLAAWGAAALLLPSIRRGFAQKNKPSPLLKTLLLAFIPVFLLTSACHSLPYEYDPAPPLTETVWPLYRDAVQPPAGPMKPFAFQGKVTFEYKFFKQATLCAVSYDESGELRVAAFSPSGGKIFELAGTADALADFWFMPIDFLEGHEEEAAEFILEDFFHIFGGLEPWRGVKNGATEIVKGDSKIIRREPVGDGKEELVSEFWGPNLPVMGKSYFKNETIDWQSWYFRYIVKDTAIFPEIIVYDNNKHGYRLILSVSELFEDSEP
jgi:predicted RND superfamily exporter protein